MFFERCCPLSLPGRCVKFAHFPRMGGCLSPSLYSILSLSNCLAVYGLWTVIQCIQQIFWTYLSSVWMTLGIYPCYNPKLAPLAHARFGSVFVLFCFLFCNSGLSRLLIYRESSWRPYLSVRHMYTFPDK